MEVLLQIKAVCQAASWPWQRLRVFIKSSSGVGVGGMVGQSISACLAVRRQPGY
ncbi:hypothetical protein [Rhodopirellula sp. MGV]|uniref:hypothetical protein n=1 Tax=Rhodopirellula sp. MGV TaxID=2023130 RepID=UPI0013041A35|nr:hypothetical protein [Rhodopirellula sp. MGV]